MQRFSDSETKSIIQTAHAAADAARDITLSYFRTSALGTENKSESDFDPVTRADREAEQAIRKVIAAHRPDDAILGEEFGHMPGSSGLTWVLDPIDGTRGFISGTPTWGTLISLAEEMTPFFGLIDQPYIGERFIGGLNLAEVQRGAVALPLRVAPANSLAEATVFTTFPEVGTEIEGLAFHAVASKARLTRYGMDCYAYALLAVGQVDLVIEAGLNSYDVHAPIAVVQAAGGIVTNWAGEPADNGGQVIAAASKKLHEEALELLQATIRKGV